jgi:hypothetical protein
MCGDIIVHNMMIIGLFSFFNLSQFGTIRPFLFLGNSTMHQKHPGEKETV